MSLVHDVNEISSSLKRLQTKATEQQMIYRHLISGMVAMHQHYRLAKNYEVSDAIRDQLNVVGVKIIQGTAQFGGFENIPEHLRNDTVNDRYEFDAKLMKSFIKKVTESGN